MPTLGLEDHQHTLIECSFPKAFVCSDFCGFVCHKQCKSNYSPTVLEDLHRATSSSYGPRPTGSISSQLRDKFSISKILPSYHYDTNPILSEDEPPSFTSKWWKKKP
ncbi:hypothetical protein BD560DRAFT_329058 [Blakeslea trispora]|nr:hypothetical protein BD560DRAFT_329058 [Blakeslea trispora]